jgi:hypothetical protein
MKVALCFIISYEHILNKENIWKEWIEHNKDIVNVYFYYGDLKKIKSKWILEHTIPPNYIIPTSYMHVIPAYISILSYALTHDAENKWFCMLTDSCCPIISPTRFREMFYANSETSIFSWKPAWWNIYFHKRANLDKLSKDLWLGNDPWFVLTKENVKQVLDFVSTQKTMTKLISDGRIANESLFAIIFKINNELDNGKNRINCSVSHLADWDRMSSPTSPHVFREGNARDINFLDKELERNPYAIFVRKIATGFPDSILKHYIYEKK